MNRLQNKVAVVTGGNSGIGLSTAKAFIDQGAKVVIFGRNQETLDSALEILGETAIAVKGDVTSDADLDALYAATVQRFGKIDIIFANAGIAHFAPLQDITDDHFDKHFDINVKGAFKTVQRALPSLNDNASIILTTSITNQVGLPGGASVYSATKAALRSFARTFSRDLLERGIRVNAISPGPIATPIFSRMDIPDEAVDEVEGQLASLVPLQRLGEPREIADTVVFLASNESTFIVGAEIVVDGGMTQL